MKSQLIGALLASWVFGTLGAINESTLTAKGGHGEGGGHHGGHHGHHGHFHHHGHHGWGHHGWNHDGWNGEGGWNGYNRWTENNGGIIEEDNPVYVVPPQTDTTIEILNQKPVSK